jgi:hypothetical protein
MKQHDQREKSMPDTAGRPKPDGPVENEADNEDLDRDYDLKSPAHKPPDGGEPSETEAPSR